MIPFFLIMTMIIGIIAVVLVVRGGKGKKEERELRAEDFQITEVFDSEKGL